MLQLLLSQTQCCLVSVAVIAVAQTQCCLVSVAVIAVADAVLSSQCGPLSMQLYAGTVHAGMKTSTSESTLLISDHSFRRPTVDHEWHDGPHTKEKNR